MVDEMRQVGKQDTHTSKSRVGAERKQSTTNPAWKGGTPSEGYKISKMEKLEGSRKERALGSGRKVKDLMDSQLLIQAWTRRI